MEHYHRRFSNITAWRQLVKTTEWSKEIYVDDSRNLGKIVVIYIMTRVRPKQTWIDWTTNTGDLVILKWRLLIKTTECKRN